MNALHAVGDFTGDGRDQVAGFDPANDTWWLARLAGGRLVIQTGGAQSDTRADAGLVRCADLDGDGRDELLVHTRAGWLLGRAGRDGALAWAACGEDPAALAPSWDGSAWWVGDFDGDGRPEVFVYAVTEDVWWLGRLEHGRLCWSSAMAGLGQPLAWPGVSTWVGQIGGHGCDVIFAFPTRPQPADVWTLHWIVGNGRVMGQRDRVSQAEDRPFAAADLEGDGWLQLLTWKGAGVAVADLRGGSFDSREAAVLAADHVLVADFDGDGRAELLARSPAGWSCGRLGAGRRLEFTAVTVPAPFEPVPGTEHWSGDFDGDGRHEVLWSDAASGDWWLARMETNAAWTTRCIASSQGRAEPPPEPLPPPAQAVLLWSAERSELLRVGERVADLGWEPTRILVGAGACARLHAQPGFRGVAQDVWDDLADVGLSRLQGPPAAVEVLAAHEPGHAAAWVLALPDGRPLRIEPAPEGLLVAGGGLTPRSLFHVLPVAATDTAAEGFRAVLQSAWSHGCLTLAGGVPRIAEATHRHPGDVAPSVPPSWRADGDAQLEAVAQHTAGHGLRLRHTSGVHDATDARVGFALWMDSTADRVLLVAGQAGAGLRIALRGGRIHASFHRPALLPAYDAKHAVAEEEEATATEEVGTGAWVGVEVSCGWARPAGTRANVRVAPLAMPPQAWATLLDEDPLADAPRAVGRIADLVLDAGPALETAAAALAAAPPQRTLRWSFNVAEAPSPAPLRAAPGPLPLPQGLAFGPAQAFAECAAGLAGAPDAAWTVAGRFLFEAWPAAATPLLSEGDLCVELSPDGTLAFAGARTAVPLDTWVQLALRAEEDGIALRLDGVRVGSLPAARFPMRAPFRIGARDGPPACFRMLELARWPQALTDEQLELLRSAADTLQLRLPDPDVRWDLANCHDRVLVDRGPAALDLVLSAPPAALRAAGPPQPCDTLLGRATAGALALDEDAAPRPCVILAPEGDGRFSMQDGAGGWLAHAGDADMFWLSAHREDRVLLRVVARVALSESLLGAVPPDWRVLYEHPGLHGRVVVLPPDVDPAPLGLGAATEATRRDDDEWDAALLAAHHRVLRGAAAAPDAAQGERVRSEWTMLRLLLDDVARGWEVVAAQAGERFPEADLVAALAAGGGALTDGVVRIPVADAGSAWSPEARAFWMEGTARRLRLAVDVAPSASAAAGERRFVVAREGGVCLWLEAHASGHWSACARVVDAEGQAFAVTAAASPVPPAAWSRLVLDWQAGGPDHPGTLALAVGDSAPSVVPSGAHPLAPGCGPLVVGAAPPECARPFRGGLRRLHLDGGGPTFGDWTLDAAGGLRVHDRSGLGLHGWLQPARQTPA